tara:strand:+ start:2752 stop:2931 length:180 start_codon:yes stop_codon:yes gene_type:complete
MKTCNNCLKPFKTASKTGRVCLDCSKRKKSCLALNKEQTKNYIEKRKENLIENGISRHD